MGETRIGGAQGFAQFLAGHGVAHEGRDHFFRDLDIGKPGESGDVGRRQGRPVLRHIESAVGCEARQQHIREIPRRRFPARGNVAHDVPCPDDEAALVSWLAGGAKRPGDPEG